MNGVKIQDAISCSVTKSSYNLTPSVPLERTETGNMGDGQGVKEVLGKGEIGSERECATRHSMKGMSVSGFLLLRKDIMTTKSRVWGS